MSHTVPTAAFLRAAWRLLRAPAWLGVGAVVGFGVPYALHLDRMVRERFSDYAFDQPSRVYARPLPLRAGDALAAEALLLELAASRYRAVDTPPSAPGTYRRDGVRFEIATRGFRGAQGAVPARRLVVALAGGRIRAVTDADTGAPAAGAFLDPARIATLYGPRQVERRFVPAAEVNPLLVATLQAVEDRDFKHHIGIDFGAILRAAIANLRAGEVVQGGSTLTQQLVRNIFLDRSVTLARKANEAALAVLIEARYPKQRILEAYLNEVYLGQQGGQAIHGMAAGAEFWFGRDLSDLAIHDVALLVGLIQGPSVHDPRRYPERAMARRGVVLDAMVATGLISEIDRAVAARAPLGVTAAGALPRNRYPAFLDLVRAQLARDFPDSVLAARGLSVLTTLAPSSQQLAEAAVDQRLKALGRRGEGLQAALVVTDARSGAVQAVVGGRDPGQPGFNRALAAARPIGSLVKPFVYLVALAQPERWSLMSALPDRAVALRQPNGRMWTPANNDGLEHGDVPLVDALARSYNLATVHLGLELEVAKVARVLEALIPGLDAAPLPSLLLGAVELSPFQVAQAYQYLAADGHPTPLFALEAVLDADGRPLTRYVQQPAAGDLVEAARLVTFALQEAARRGTASALVGLGLGGLDAAGKTGTSNDQRDSWFAGYTGRHLAVVWVGRDDNRETGLYGATGAMRIWAALMAGLPTDPLRPDFSADPMLAWVDPQAQAATDPGCTGARQLPFIRGYEPMAYGGGGVGDWFGRESDAREDEEPRRRRSLLDWFGGR
ncbi:MAG: penicillin-binding protein 1B [Pseudomonadota bacterium]